MKNKRVRLTMLLMCVLMLLPTQAFAAENDFVVDMPSVSTRSYDSSFSLDFSESSAWYLNFDNNAFAFLNHRYVTAKYDSCSPSNSRAKVKVELYIDEDKDGNYEIYDPDGGYTYS